jgi:N-carbamoylputrescine amidase
LKLSVCQLPDGLSIDHPAWADLLRRIENDRPDIAVLNEMPFGSWLASHDTFDPGLATASVRDHERAIANLHEISTAVLSSRPVPGTHKLSNEAFLTARNAFEPICRLAGSDFRA